MKMRVTSRGEDKKLLDNNNSDSSMTGIIMRASQPFALRYPLVEVEGSYGSLVESGNWASPRYCLTGDSIVNTGEGLFRMKELASNEENSDHPVNLTLKGKDRITTASVMFNSGSHPTYKVHLMNGMEFEGTANHPVLTQDGWVTIAHLNTSHQVIANIAQHDLFGTSDINPKVEALIARRYSMMRLSNDVLQASRANQEKFIYHLFDQIGFIDPFKHLITFAAKNKRMLQDLQIILATNFKILSMISSTTGEFSKSRLTLIPSGVYPFIELLVRNSEYKEIGIKKYKEQLEFENYIFETPDLVPVQVLGVNYNGHKVVYSPKVNEEGNEYTANALVHHNTSARLSPVGTHLFQSINNDTIREWRENYDGTAQYPAVLPTKGFYGIVNGTSGIGV